MLITSQLKWEWQYIILKYYFSIIWND